MYPAPPVTRIRIKTEGLLSIFPLAAERAEAHKFLGGCPYNPSMPQKTTRRAKTDEKLQTGTPLL
jgi:hypothetical protein